MNLLDKEALLLCITASRCLIEDTVVNLTFVFVISSPSRELTRASLIFRLSEEYVLLLSFLLLIFLIFKLDVVLKRLYQVLLESRSTTGKKLLRGHAFFMLLIVSSLKLTENLTIRLLYEFIDDLFTSVLGSSCSADSWRKDYIFIDNLAIAKHSHSLSTTLRKPLVTFVCVETSFILPSCNLVEKVLEIYLLPLLHLLSLFL